PRRAPRAAVLPGAAWRQRHADRRHAEVELSADLAPEGGIHAAGATDLGGREAAGAVTQAALVWLSIGPVAGGVGGRRGHGDQRPVLRDGREARQAARESLAGMPMTVHRGLALRLTRPACGCSQ